MPSEVARKLFNVDEYYRMAESGILKEDDRVELIEGEIIQMSPIGSRHAATVFACHRLLDRQVGDSFFVRVQSPVRLDSFSEPEPDIALVKPRSDLYRESHPAAEDVVLVLEVMDTSLRFDRLTKLPLYARAGIPEVWLIDLNQEQVEVYTSPQAGAFVKHRVFSAGERIRSATLDLEAGVEELLP